MVETPSAGTLARMETEDGETRGQLLRARMEKLGMAATDLAEEAGVSRNTLYRIFGDNPAVEEKNWRAVERALDQAEKRFSGPSLVSTEQGLIEFEVSGDFGVKVVVKGPVADRDAIEETVVRIIRDIKAGKTADDQ